jgi:hypothetical protein
MHVGSERPAYPVRIGADGRHLVDQREVPYLVQGDTAWSLIAALNEAEVERYLAHREEQGFNAILVNLIEHYYRGPENAHGDAPFTTPADFATPNERYFDYADWVISKAADHGILVFLAPLYLGAIEKEGWVVEAMTNGVEACRTYGRYVGARYAGLDNIIWVTGGDRNPGTALEHVNALAAGIKEANDRHLITAHCRPEFPPPDQYPGNNWLTLNATYTYGIVHRKLLADYRHTPTLPFILIETTYEGEHNASALQIRRQAYGAILCGATGQIFGNNPIWLFNPGWEEALDSQGCRDMVHLKSLFDSRPWAELVPDLDGAYTFIPDLTNAVVTKGRGEFIGLDYVAAARTLDGGTVIIYLPQSHTITVNLSKVTGTTARGWWFNPRNGDAQPAGEFPTTGTPGFTPPGEGDWVLVLDDAARGLDRPGW